MASEAAAVNQAAREDVWRELESRGLAGFPRPVRGRIPNYRGSTEAAERAASLPEFLAAHVIKVNPDAPQRPLRTRALAAGKTLVAATPRLREGFLVLDPRSLPAGSAPRASSIGGLFHYGTPTAPEDLPPIDLIVVGAVAVSAAGARTGKGEGYGEIEYALLRSLGKLRPDTPLLTTVHDIQVLDDLPTEPFDVPVDIIVTPTRVIRTASVLPRPSGIIWELLPQEKLEAIPLLERYRPRETPPHPNALDPKLAALPAARRRRGGGPRSPSPRLRGDRGG